MGIDDKMEMEDNIVNRAENADNVDNTDNTGNAGNINSTGSAGNINNAGNAGNSNSTGNTDTKRKSPKTKRKKSGRFRGVLYFLQHVLIAVAVIAILVVTTGSTVVINGLHGSESYNLLTSDQEKVYEESELFNRIYGKAAADIIRFGVIRSQLETDGRFDGQKVIDVTAYNYRDKGMPERYVTARYYLEDLLKWQKYGTEYTTVSMTAEQERDFLSDTTVVTIVDPDSKYYNTSDAGYMKSDIGSYTFVDDVSSNLLPLYGDDDYYDEEIIEETEYDILVNRYKSVEDKNVEDYTADWENYRVLCANIETAMKSLSHNYEEYLKYKEYYDSRNTNVRYLIEKTVGSHTEYFTNMVDFSIDGTQENDDHISGVIEGIFDGKFNENNIKYLYYSPSEMIYESNTDIKESTIRNIVQEYDYAYPESIRIWIGVDTSYPVNDAFSQGKAGFGNYLPYFWQWIILAVCAVVLYFILLIYLTAVTGRETDKEGNTYIKLTGFDKIPTEAGLLLGMLAAALIFLAAMLVIKFADTNMLNYRDVYTVWFKAAAGAAALIVDAVFFFFFYSLVRRIKAKTLWQNSCLKWLIQKISKLLLNAYDNGNIIVRTWVPYIIFLLFNLLLALAGAFSSILLTLAILIVDVLVGAALYLDVKERQNIVAGIEKISEGDFSYQLNQENLHGDNLVLAKSVNSIGTGIKNAVEISMKDERMKADLITNVSHDIKTPLTSIINYVDLIKREEIDNERVRSYIAVLDEKSQRLKQLTDDLVEASKISSGNISLHFEKINLTELLNQTIGEFSEKFEQKGLAIVMNVNAAGTTIEADSRSIWRVMENLFNNICKYALEHTRIYIVINCPPKEGVQNHDMIEISIKNISAKELNCNPEELTERFIRGDEARTTEGSGLGLSIAKNLTEAQNGTFEIQLDGDLFKVILTFPVVQN